MASDGFPVFARQQRSRRLRVRPRSLLTAAALVSALTLGGCAVEVVELQNTQPAREYAQQSALPGTIYAGWRVFQDKCT
ncbi:MAG: hypothetical protein IH627_17455, partial [Rubrivivax sp.]|nr:hypothetical protein [Rubrivivax sp.]